MRMGTCLSDRLEQIAQEGKFGKACFLWKNQISQLRKVKKGLRIAEILEYEKAYYLCYVDWMHPTVQSFSEGLHRISLEACEPVFCTDYQSAVQVFKKPSIMKAMSSVIRVDNEEILEELKANGFECFKMNENAPFVVYVSWYRALSTSSEATNLRSSAIYLLLSEKASIV